MSTTYDFDLAVIGAGPAGEKAAAQAAYFGKRVAIIERARDVGGACVNTGTLPSKTLRETALFLSGFRQRQLYGFTFNAGESVSVAHFMSRQEPVCGSELARIRENLGRHRIELLWGSAKLLDEHTLEVAERSGGTRTLSSDVVLIATGSTPFQPPHIPFADPDIDDSDTILELDRIPRTMVILGGGVIGCEYATIFAPLGVKVTLVEARDKMLPFLDLEMTQLLVEKLDEIGIDVITKAEAKSVEKRADGLVHVLLSNGKELVSEKLLFAAGRNGNTRGLGLEGIGVTPDKRGQVKVDEHFRIEGARGGRVYAAGDVIGFPALASTSMEQGRVAVCHAFDLGYKTKVSEHLPYGIYTIPEVSFIGETEQSCEAKGIDYVVGRARYRDNARGQIVGDLDGMLKLIFAADDKRLLGVHIIGERATELVHIGQMVIHAGGPIDTFIYEVFNYPTLSEMYKYAAYDGLGNLARRNALLRATG